MHPQGGHLTAVIVERAVGIERSKLTEQLLAFQQVGPGWGFQPGQRIAQASPPLGELQHQRGRVCFHHSGWIEGRSALLFGRAPEPQRPAGPQPAGATGPLLGTGQAGRNGHQALHAAHRIEAAAATEAAINHQGDPLDGEGAFGDGRGQDHLAAGLVAGADGAALLSQRQIAVQRTHLQLRAPAGFGDGLLGLLNLPLPWQKHQHRFVVAPLVEPVAFEGADHLRWERFPLPRRLVADGHRMTASLAAEQHRFWQLLHQRLQVERGGHHQEPQLRHQQVSGLTQ